MSAAFLFASLAPVFCLFRFATARHCSSGSRRDGGHLYVSARGFATTFSKERLRHSELRKVSVNIKDVSLFALFFLALFGFSKTSGCGCEGRSVRSVIAGGLAFAVLSLLALVLFATRRRRLDRSCRIRDCFKCCLVAAAGGRRFATFLSLPYLFQIRIIVINIHSQLSSVAILDATAIGKCVIGNWQH